MLPKTKRLNRIEIGEIKRNQNALKVLQGSYFGLVYQKTDSDGKFGVIISNKVLNKAVQRNKVKRLLYKVIEKKWLDRKGNFLFLAKKNCSTCTLAGIENEITFFESNPFLSKVLVF